MTPIPPADEYENANPPYGIRTPKAGAPARLIPRSFDRIGQDISTALAEFGLPPVLSEAVVVAASQAARDTHWGIPSTAPARLALQALGAITVRTDTGNTERYYANATDGGTNPGGKPTAGWYNIGGGSSVAVALRKSANQSLTASATALSWDVEISDPAGMHDNVTNNTRLTAPVAGLYNVVASLYNGNTAGMGTTYARLNGTTDIPGSLDRRTADATAALPLKSAFPVSLGVGDYVEIMVLHATAAGTIAGGTSQGAATVSMVRVGA